MARRLIDALFALVALALLLPSVGLLGLLRRVRRRSLAVYGRLGRPLRLSVVRVFRHGRARRLNRWPLLWAVLAGRLSLVGPRPVALHRPRPAYASFAVRPGLVSSQLLRERANIAHDSRDVVDAGFIRSLSLKTYVAVLLKFALSTLLGRRAGPPQDVVALLDVKIHNHTMAEALGRIASLARAPGLSQVAFVNADCFNIAAREAAYRALLQRVPLVLADGIGIHVALKRFLRTPLKDNVNGTDLFPRLCRMAREQDLGIFLLGARPGVAQAVAQAAVQRVPGLRIVGVQDGYFAADATDAAVATDAVIDRINASGAHILLVAMGAPRQDQWIAAHADRLRPGVALGVGGLFDFYSGRIARAPMWMRELGLEWAYRLLQEPGRMWRRYLVGNPLFLWRVWRWQQRRAAAARRDDGVALGGQRG